jgi:hypothetical protein
MTRLREENETRMKPGRIAVLLIAAVALVAAGCGGSDDSSGDTAAPAASAAASTAAAAGTEASTAAAAGGSSAAAVAAGLQQMVATAADVATKTATDPEAGKTAAEGLEPSWAPIEETVKANDPDAYVDIEDAMAQLESGDAAKAVDGSTRIAAAITAYLAAHPG